MTGSRPWSALTRRLGWALAALALLAAWFSPGAAARRPPNPYFSAATDLQLVRHPLLGAIAAPNALFSAAFEDLPPVESRANEFGFRGPPPSSDPSAVQFALVGDEFLFGLGLADAELAPTRLDERVAESFDSRPVRVLNLGVIGANLETKLECAGWVVEGFPLAGVAVLLGKEDHWTYFDRVRDTSRRLDERLGHIGRVGPPAPRLPGRVRLSGERIKRLLDDLHRAAGARGTRILFVPPPDGGPKREIQKVIDLARERGFEVAEPGEKPEPPPKSPEAWSARHRELADRLAPWALQAAAR
jgi:hypothetical protein